MAARRIVKSSINWAQLAERVPKEQKTNFFAFKARSDKYLRAMIANPENPPELEWADYKKSIALTQMVDQFQKAYAEVKVPYPPDNVTSQINEQEKQMKAEVADFIKNSNDKITEYQKQIAYLQSLIPFEQMTMEDFRDAYPELALDPINRPTFWPHDAEEQMDYRDKGHPLYGHNPHAEH